MRFIIFFPGRQPHPETLEAWLATWVNERCFAFIIRTLCLGSRACINHLTRGKMRNVHKLPAGAMHKLVYACMLLEWKRKCMWQKQNYFNTIYLMWKLYICVYVILLVSPIDTSAEFWSQTVINAIFSLFIHQNRPKYIIRFNM